MTASTAKPCIPLGVKVLHSDNRDLFSATNLDSPAGNEGPAIDGLGYFPGFISESEEAELLASVDAAPWLPDLRRRVQHLGYKYDYKARRVDQSMYLGPLPPWVRTLVDRLVTAGHVTAVPDQLIVNEYLPGQGISSHVDCVPCFGPILCGLSLGSQILMDLAPAAGGEKISILLEPRSLLVLAGAARYQWKHAIAARKTDRIAGQLVQRRRRVSLTFRNVIRDGD